MLSSMERQIFFLHLHILLCLKHKKLLTNINDLSNLSYNITKYNHQLISLDNFLFSYFFFGFLRFPNVYMSKHRNCSNAHRLQLYIVSWLPETKTNSSSFPFGQ